MPYNHWSIIFNLKRKHIYIYKFSLLKNIISGLICAVLQRLLHDISKAMLTNMNDLSH